MKITAFSREVLALVMAATICMMMAMPVAGVLRENLSGVAAYPNPFRTKLAHTAITFDNLTEDATITVYATTGEEIVRISASSPLGRYVWNVTNASGASVATGVYVYVVTNAAGQKALGKLVILK